TATSQDQWAKRKAVRRAEGNSKMRGGRTLFKKQRLTLHGGMNSLRRILSVKRMGPRFHFSLNCRLMLMVALCLFLRNPLTAQSSGSDPLGAGSAFEWPEFRGPGGQGISNARNVPLNWSSSSNIVWRAEIPGSGWSSPVLRGGRLYGTTEVIAAEQRSP